MFKQIVEGFRLSAQQQRLWSTQEEGAQRRSRCAVTLQGTLAPEFLAAALRRVIERHEILRTRFERVSGTNAPLQVIDEVGDYSLSTVDLRGREREEQRLSVQEYYRQAGLARYCYEAEVLQATLLQLEERRHVLILSVYGLCADARSMQTLVEELVSNYGTDLLVCEMPSKPVQYADFSEWQNDLLTSEQEKEGRDFWRQQNLHELSALKLPFERLPEGSAKCEPRAFVLLREGDAVKQLEAIGSLRGAPLSVVLLVCWQVLLWRLTGEPEVAVYTAFDGRRFDYLRGTLGLYTQYIPIRCHIRGDFQLDELLGVVQENVGAISKRQGHFFHDPHEAEAEGVTPEATPPRVAFNYQEYPPQYEGAGLSFTIGQLDGTTEYYKLRLCCSRQGDSLRCEFHYDPSVYQEATVRRLAQEFDTLLGSVLRDATNSVAMLEVLAPSERQQMLSDWNQTQCDFSMEECIHQLFETQVRRTPEALAVICEDERISYRELNRQSDRVAHRLRHLGIRTEDRVGLFVERSAGMIAALLGILKAGGTYVPLDPRYPQARLSFMLKDAGIRVLLTQQRLAHSLPTHQAQVLLLDGDLQDTNCCEGAGAAPVTPDNLAYVIYTSGSTGQPKGVMVSHRSVCNLLGALERAVYVKHMQGASRVSLNAPLAFDASVKQLIQLLAGHTLVLIPDETRLDAAALLDYLYKHRVEVFDCTPSQLRLLLDAGLQARESDLRVVLVGGESYDAELWRRTADAQHLAYYNLYGPTECTVDATASRVVAGCSTSVGRPLANTTAYVLDPSRQLAPVGVAGELYLGGNGIARGYLRLPELTAERFVPHPFGREPGERLYRTGDLACYTEDGCITLLGRADSQVKLRGYRIELGEIESVLNTHPAIRESAVLVREDQETGPQLVGYIVPRAAASASHDSGQWVLPNGMRIAHCNRNETEHLYEEIFVRQSYLQHGVRLPERPCVFDVGANIGMFTLFVKQQRPEALIFAFEPVESVHRMLRRNVMEYGHAVRLFEEGLSDEERVESFTFYPYYTTLSGQSRYADATGEMQMIKRYLHNEQGRGSPGAGDLMGHLDELLAWRLETYEQRCRLRRLSDVIREEGLERIDLLKVDVQRAELDVLCGIDEEDFERIAQIVLEVHDATDGESAGRLGQIRSMLEARGYEVLTGQDDALIGTDRYYLYATRRETVASWPLVPGVNDETEDCRKEEALAARDTPLLRVSGEWDGATASDDEQLASQVRQYTRERLPEYMLPLVVVLDRLPLTRSGKVDRQALPSPAEAAAVRAKTEEMNLTWVEELVRDVYRQMLGIQRVPLTKSFFDLGGHSLLAIQVVSRLCDLFSISVTTRQLFEESTVRGLSHVIVEALQKGERTAAPLIRRASRDEELPLSFAQQRLWFLNQIEPHSAFYNNPTRVRVEGLLDIFALERTLQEVLRRHETLRTTFRPQRGSAVQVISAPRPLALPVIDLSALPIAEREDEFRLLAREEARRSFDLAEGTLFKSQLLRMGEEEHVALLTTHHIVSDGWSRGVLIREVAALYEAYARGEESPLPELEIQYADYAAWQREWMTGEVLDASLVYWRRQLGADLPVLELPTDHRRPAVQSYRGARESFVLSRQLTERLEELSRREGCTLFMVLLAGFQVLLSRYSGQEDIIVGTPIAGRTRTELEPLIGFFVNMLALRTDLSGDPSFKELLRRVREVTLGAYTHQEVPFEKLVEELQPTRDMSRTPLFQVVFALQNAPRVALELPGLKLSEVEAEGETAKFDLTLTLTGDNQGMHGSAEFNTDVFEVETIRRMLAHFKVLLTHLSLEPEVPVSQAELLTAEEKKRLLVEWNETRSEYERGKCIPELFEEQVERTPTALAVADSAEQLSYQELNRRANRLAHRLRNLGVGPEVVVGVFLERTALRIVGMLGVLKAGGAYLPLDPSTPPERVAFMLADTRARVMLTHQDFPEALLPEGVRAVCPTVEDEAPFPGAEENPESGVRAENLAYIVYTSGSTGQPKGVGVSHANLHNLVDWYGRACALTSADRGGHMVAFNFDPSVLEVWPYLCSGASLHIPEEENLSSPARILDWLSAKGVTICFLATPLAEAVLALPAPPKLSLRKLLTGGDKLTRRPRKDQGYDLVDHYGPAEVTVVTTSAEISSADVVGASPDIGRPISNTQVYVLDKNLNPVAQGVAGELYAGGESLARGYVGQPVSTAEKYLPDPFGREPGGRLYRTGDLARYLPDGRLEFLGRADRQVKIRGCRVEPGEIECVLAQHPAVRDAAVIVRSDTARGNSLICYLVAQHDRRPPSADELRDFLWGKLPEFMVPAEFNTLDALPLTPNGKLDRSALGAMRGLATEPRTEYVAPAEGLEQTVAGVWRDVLGVEKVGVYDKFFELGGHSLALMQVKDRLREELGRDIPIADLFSHPTINSLSKFLGRDEAVEDPAAVRHERTRRRDEALGRRKRLVREGGKADD